MIYTIYTAEGARRTDFEGNSNSTHDHKVQTNNELSLSFTLHDYVELNVNDYVEIESMRFVLMKPYRPLMKSTKEYVYDVKFYGPENIAGTAIFLDADYNPISSYYDTPSAQLAYIVSCINRVIGRVHYHVGEVISSEPVKVEYTRGSTCLEALSVLSTTCKTEWWLDGVNFNLSKCEHGTPVSLGYGMGLLKLEKELTDTDDFFTRLLPTGSSKNIIAAKYGHNTLQLPGGKKWIDRNVDLYGIKEKWEESAFADIFPRFTGTVGTVRTEERTIEGTEVVIYYFKSPDIPFNPNEYSVANTYKHVVFKSGDLLGQDFEANWNESTAEWELITQYPTELTQLPGDNIIPRTGDKYTVYNLDMPDEYYPLAEQEYEEAVNSLLDDAAIDYATYKGPTDSVFLEDNNLSLSLGRRVRLNSDIYFADGYRESRITRIVRKLSNLNDMDIEISNTIIKGQYAQMKSDVSELKNNFAQTLANEMLNIIRTDSSADLSDTNVLSSLRTLKEIKARALSRLGDDNAEGLIKFLKGLISIGDIDAKQGITIGESVIDSLIAGAGIIAKDGRIQADRMQLRSSLTVLELIFNRLSGMESDYSFSESGTIESVELMEDGTYNLPLRKRWDNDFTALSENDVVYGVVNDLASGSGRYYTSWLRVLHVDTAANMINAVMYPDGEVPGGKNYPPEPLMILSHRGNPVNEERQGYWYLSSREKCICMLDGVTKPKLEEHNYAVIIGKLKQLSLFDNLPINYLHSYIYCRGIAIQDILKIGYNGAPIVQHNDRGFWSATPDPAYSVSATSADTVWHVGCKWLCLINGTTDIPRYGAAGWAMIEGNPDFTIEIESSNGWYFDADKFATTLSIKGYLYNGEVTAHILDGDVEWSRDTGNVTEDNAWAVAHAEAGKSLPLTVNDLGPDYMMMTGCKFIARVLLRDGQGNYESTNFTTF